MISSMRASTNTALAIHEILKQYIVVQDRIFRFSLRKIIPIPGIFKAIDYGKHHKELDSLRERLENLLERLQESDDFTSLVRQYGEAVLETILVLRKMCEQLFRKSQGDLGSYSKKQYNQDLATYEACVNRYRALGLRLNEYF